MERLNKDCSFDGCLDRQKSWELQRTVERLTQEKETLYTQVENIKNTLKDNKESIIKVFKELLVGVKVTKDGKVLDMDKLNEELEKVAVKMDDDKVSGIVHNNLELQNQLHDLQVQNASLEKYKKEYESKIKSLEMEKAVRSEKDIQLIRDTSKAQSQMVDLVKQRDDLALEVLKMENHKKAIQADISDARKEADIINKQYQEAADGLRKVNEEVEFLRKEVGFYKKFTTWRTKFQLMRISTCKKNVERGRLDKAKKQWVTIQSKQPLLNELEKKIVLKEYDALMRLMGQ